MGDEAELLAIAQARDAALVANDAALIADFMTDDWVYVGPDGVTPKADIVGWIASGRLVHHTMAASSPIRVARHGDAAVLTARRASTGSWDGVEYAADEWISEVYVRPDGRWRCAFSQKTPL